MDNKEVNKPEQVLWLEEQLGFYLNEIKNVDEILLGSNIGAYTVNIKGDIIGVNLSFNEIKNLFF